MYLFNKQSSEWLCWVVAKSRACSERALAERFRNTKAMQGKEWKGNTVQ